MSGTSMPAGTRWVSSTYSGAQGGQCVQWAPEHAAVTGAVPVRDSKAPTGPQLCFSGAAWAAFVSTVRVGSPES